MGIAFIIILLVFSYSSNFEHFSSNFEMNYKKFDTKEIISSLRSSYIEIDASFGSKNELFKLILDIDTQATVIPSIDAECVDGDVHKFDISKSSTFKNRGSEVQFLGEKFYEGIKGEDSFKLGNSKDIKNISFIVANEYLPDICLNIKKYSFLGLKEQVANPELESHNIIRQMTSNKLISLPTWFLKFDSYNKGKFIIGALPHQIYNNTYNEKYFFNRNFSNQKNMYSLDFDDIYYGKKEEYDKRKSSLIHKTVIFDLNSRILQCTDDYGNIIYENFFKEKIEKNICKRKLLEDNYIYYYCYKDKFNMNEMNNLNFVLQREDDENMTLIFEPKDLFYEYNNILYYMIIYKPNDFIKAPDTYWKVGTLFLEKHLLAFDRDKKLVYVYMNSNEDKKDENTNRYLNVFVIFIIIIAIKVGLSQIII